MTKEGTLPVMNHERGWANVHKNGSSSLETISGGTSKMIKRNICSRMSKYENGTRSIIRVQ